MGSDDPNKDWLFNEEPAKSDDFDLDEERTKRKTKKRIVKKSYSFGSKLKYKLSKFRNKFHRRPHKTVSLPICGILGLFVPLFVGLLTLYLLMPGMSMASQYFDSETTIHFLLISLLLPAEAQSIVPWIAWIFSGFAGGFLAKRILIPFVSMYILVWMAIYLIEGNLFLQQFSMFGSFGLEQIIIQTLAVNFIYAILSFGFGGWIGISIGGR